MGNGLVSRAGNRGCGLIIVVETASVFGVGELAGMVVDELVGLVNLQRVPQLSTN